MCWYGGLRGVAGVAVVCGAIACGGSTKSNGAGNGDGDETGGSSPVGSGGGNGTGGNGTGGSGTGGSGIEEECSRSLEDFCAAKERQGFQFLCDASSYDDVLELTQSWPIDCEVYVPDEVEQTGFSYYYGSCAGGGRFISEVRNSVSETYHFNSEGELVGVYLGNKTGDPPCSYGTLPCQIDVIEFETCPLGGGDGGAGGDNN